MKLKTEIRKKAELLTGLTEAQRRRLRRSLLKHYDLKGRRLPWRIRPEDRALGTVADPYAVWLSEIMLQQTTVAHATPYWQKFLSEFPTVSDLANADRDRVLTLWAGLGYYARARNLHKCAQQVRDMYNGVFPKSEAELLKLPGIGLYTAAAMAAICYNEATNIVDGNVERVISRLFAVEHSLPKARKTLRALAGEIADPNRPGDYGQAIMDLGAKTCTPRNPDCNQCPWKWKCAAFQAGNMTDYPKKEKKIPRPIREGAVFILGRAPETLKSSERPLTQDMDETETVMITRRPDKGLLGGMMGFSGTPWIERLAQSPDKLGTDSDLDYAPVARNWERVPGEVRHIFTHFDLRLRVYRATLPVSAVMDELKGEFVKISEIENYALPTVMKKALELALEA